MFLQAFISRDRSAYNYRFFKRKTTIYKFSIWYFCYTFCHSNCVFQSADGFRVQQNVMGIIIRVAVYQPQL